MLEPHLPSSILGRVASPPPPVEIDGDVEYEISEIVDSKIDKRRKCPLLYRVRWLGYENTDDEFEWIPASELEHAAVAVPEIQNGSRILGDPFSASGEDPFSTAVCLAGSRYVLNGFPCMVNVLFYVLGVYFEKCLDQ